MGKYVVTGTCGLIGAKVAELLLAEGHDVVGVDNMSKTYDVSLKRHRLKTLESKRGFGFTEVDVRNRSELREIFDSPFEAVIHLAAVAGVRPKPVQPANPVAVKVPAMATNEVARNARTEPRPAASRIAKNRSAIGTRRIRSSRATSVNSAPPMMSPVR